MKFRFVYYPAQIVFSNRCNVNCHGHHHIVVQTSRFHGPAHELQSDIQTISNQSAKSESYDTCFFAIWIHCRRNWLSTLQWSHHNKQILMQTIMKRISSKSNCPRCANCGDVSQCVVKRLRIFVCSTCQAAHEYEEAMSHQEVLWQIGPRRHSWASWPYLTGDGGSIENLGIAATTISGYLFGDEE